MRRVMLTGATGLVGRQAQTLLAACGYEVHAVARRAPSRKGARVAWHAVDLLDAKSTSETVSAIAPTDLLHLAWCSDPDTYWESPENERWLAASVSLLTAFTAAGGRRAVVAGTCAEYDWGCADAALSESHTPLAPRGAYGRAKDALRRELTEIAEREGFSAAWGRLFFLFGPGEHPKRLVASVAKALAAGEPAPCSEGRQLRDYLPSSEAADALVALLSAEVTGPVNVASGTAVSVRELVGLIGEVAGRPDLLRFGAVPSRLSEPARIEADTRRLANEVGWRPRRSLREAMAETVDHWRRKQALIADRP